MEIKKFNIESVADVKEFFTWLADNSLLIHPDDKFAWFLDFADEENPSVITAEQADDLDNMMEDCFDVCEAEGTDIYDIALQFGWER